MIDIWRTEYVPRCTPDHFAMLQSLACIICGLHQKYENEEVEKRLGGF
jgi:hypothetical protein